MHQKKEIFAHNDKNVTFFRIEIFYLLVNLSPSQIQLNSNQFELEAKVAIITVVLLFFVVVSSIKKPTSTPHRKLKFGMQAYFNLTR